MNRVLAPGCIAYWIGNELFKEPSMSVKGVMRCPKGGVAFLTSVVRMTQQDNIGWFAYVIINGQTGWSPTNWLEKIA